MTTRVRRFALGAALALLIVGTWLLIPSASLVSGRLVAWHVFLPPYDVANATTTVVPIEGMRPDCVPHDDSWFEPVIAYTPVSVTIRLRVVDAIPATCPAIVDGRMRIGSSYHFGIHLSEPLAGRPLFDGSKFPAAAQPYR